MLIVENGSTDGSADVVIALAQYPRLGLLELPTPDYGAAMRAGFLATGGDWVVNFDIDYFSGGVPRRCDIARGGRHRARIQASSGLRGPPLALPAAATWGFNVLLRTVLASGVSDTHGMKAVRRRVVTEIAPQVVSTEDLFDTELVIRAERAGYRVVEVPVTVRELRESKTRLFHRVPRTLKGLWRIRRMLR